MADVRTCELRAVLVTRDVEFWNLLLKNIFQNYPSLLSSYFCRK